MHRVIQRFRPDDEGEWVAELSCLHAQHVRHRPPWQDRAWVQTDAGRQLRIGSEIECPSCDRAELPDGLRVVRTAGPFDEGTVPAGLLREHRVAEGTWACLRVIEGSLHFSLAGEPHLDVRLVAGAAQAIPPGMPHVVTVDGPVQFAVDFLARDEVP
jgi:tellurite resistance-related uncharacterized protein